MKKPTLTAVDAQSMAKDETMHQFYKEMEVDVLARTLWGEARGEGTKGMQAVANVILNRVTHAQENGGFWWGNNIIQVCQKPYQFSCWNRADPNFKKLQAVDESDLYFLTAKRLARRAVADLLEDLSCGATHYHADTVRPYWARVDALTAVVGRHYFYRLV